MKVRKTLEWGPYGGRKWVVFVGAMRVQVSKRIGNFGPFRIRLEKWIEGRKEVRRRDGFGRVGRS